METGTEVLLKDGRIVFLKNISPEAILLFIKGNNNVTLEAKSGVNWLDIKISDIKEVLLPEKSIA